MKYTKEQRLAIGKRVYTGEITRELAAFIYNIETSTARNYMRLYRDSLDAEARRAVDDTAAGMAGLTEAQKLRMRYINMTIRELIVEMIRVREALEAEGRLPEEEARLSEKTV